MTRKPICFGTVLGIALLATGPAMAQTIETLLDFDDMRVGAQFNYVGAHAFDGDTAYAIIRGIESDVTPEFESQVTRIDNFGTTPTTTVLVTNAEWKALIGGDAFATILPGERMGIIDGQLQFVDRATDTIYRVDVINGGASVFVSNASIVAHTGESQARLIGATAIAGDGRMAVYDEESDSVLVADDMGALSTLIADAEFETLYGSAPINNVAGGMTFDAFGDLYWTLTQTGSTGSAGGSVYRYNGSDGSLELVVSPQAIWDATGEIGNVAFNDIFAAPDGNIYFYDRRGDVDSILYFSPSDPEGTLTVLLSEADIQAGPIGMVEINIDSLNAYDGGLTWHHFDAFTGLFTTRLAGSPGDFDLNGRVDMLDAAEFSVCFDQLVSSNGPCVPADLDESGFVDVDDWPGFEDKLKGPIAPIAP